MNVPEQRFSKDYRLAIQGGTEKFSRGCGDRPLSKQLDNFQFIWKLAGQKALPETLAPGLQGFAVDFDIELAGPSRLEPRVEIQMLTDGGGETRRSGLESSRNTVTNDDVHIRSDEEFGDEPFGGCRFHFCVSIATRPFEYPGLGSCMIGNVHTGIL